MLFFKVKEKKEPFVFGESRNGLPVLKISRSEVPVTVFLVDSGDWPSLRLLGIDNFVFG
jgi:hypothetical protein